MAYWSKSNAELGDEFPTLRGRIVARQQNVSELITSLFGANPLKYDCDAALIPVLDAVSGGDFGNPQKLAEVERLSAIYVSSSRLCHVAKSSRRKLPRAWLA